MINSGIRTDVMMKKIAICSASILFVCIIAITISACGKVNTEIERNDNAVKITNSTPRSSQNPVFSPEGNFIVYTRFLDGYNLGSSELVKIRRDGSDEHIIVSAANSNNVNVPYGSWVGNKICFASDRGGRADEIWLVNDDGSNLTQITFHDEYEEITYIEPVFNPQNTNQIIFEYITGENDLKAIHQIALLEIDSGNISLLTDGAFDDRLPSWSEDGKKILFQRNEYGQDEGWMIYVADIDVNAPEPLGNIRTISHGTSDDTDCSWSYDNNYVLSSSNYGNLPAPNIFMFPVNTTFSPVQKTFSLFFEDGAPSQSPNGEWIVFESHYGETEEDPSEIWIIKSP